MKTTHVMVGSESLGLQLNSAILSIGAVEFDPYSDQLGRTFHMCIPLAESLANGLTIDAGALAWWLKQEGSARERMAHKLTNGYALYSALSTFTGFIVAAGGDKNAKFWSCGMMDIAWLTSAYNALGLEVPWGYRVGDYRTIRDELAEPGDAPEATTSHDALADAIWQAKLMQNIYRRLGKHE